MQYSRILLKLSGESLAGNGNQGISDSVLEEYSKQVIEVINKGCEVAIVIGGGNIFRGLSGTESVFDRLKGDQMGMLATVINSLALEGATLRQDLDDNATIYGHKLENRAIVTTGVHVPKTAARLIALLNKYSLRGR